MGFIRKICTLFVKVILFCCVVTLSSASINTSPSSDKRNDVDDVRPMVFNKNEDIVQDRFHGPFHDPDGPGVDEGGNKNKNDTCHDGHHGIHLASWRWCDYYEHILFCLIVILAGIFKLVFHHTPLLSNYFPESCALIIIGIISGSFIYYGVNSADRPFPRFTSALFFNYLLPPIVLDAAYSLYDRDFLYNIGSIITFAVIGTLFNVFTVGFGLYFINYLGK